MADMKIKVGTAPEISNCITKKLEQLITTPSNESLGETLIAKQRLELAPFAAVEFSGWGNWEQDPLKNRSWQWRLNWLSFLSYLMAYHRASDDDSVLCTAREAIQSWLDTYLETDTSYPFEFIWHDHATALRAEQLAFFVYYCRQYARSWAKQHGEFLEYVEQALIVHGGWLARDSFYSEHTNHGLEQARVLLLLGTVFEGDLAREWQEIAIRRISRELEFSFTQEGVHVENSPAYHIFVFKVFMGIIKDYPADVLGDLDEQFSQFSAKALSFITHILRPDGKLPPIGDTEQLPTSDGYREMFGHTLEYQYFLYAVTQGKQGLVPPVLNRVYPQSGYAIFRDQWPATEHYGKAFHLIAKVGCSSRYHHQQDEGHISLYAGGEDWLIDSGMYNYINHDPVRKYMRARVGHNVPMISHTGYAKEFEHRLGAWQVTAHSETAGKPYLNMQLDVLTPVQHTRRVSFDANSKIVESEDRVIADDGQPRSITLQWHFPKDKNLVIEGNRVMVTSPSGNRLHIDFEGDTPDNLSIAKGQNEDRVFSCISYKANQVEPSQVLRVLFKERTGLGVVTRFSFEMAEGKVAPEAGPAMRTVQTLTSLLASRQESGLGQHTLVLGSAPASLELAKAHRAQCLGHVGLLVNDTEQCREIQTSLSRHYLTTWLTCRPLHVSRSTPITVDKSAVQGLEGIELLVISVAGFTEKRLAAVLLTMMPMLLQRMSKTGQIWCSDSLSDRLKALCESWAVRHELAITYVAGLEEAVE